MKKNKKPQDEELLTKKALANILAGVILLTKRSKKPVGNASWHFIN